jgi:hypothetical protein
LEITEVTPNCLITDSDGVADLLLRQALGPQPSDQLRPILTRHNHRSAPILDLTHLVPRLIAESYPSPSADLSNDLLGCRFQVRLGPIYGLTGFE